MIKETKKAAHAREVAENLAKKEAARAKMYAEMKAHPVGKAVEPLLKDAVQSAAEDSQKYIDHMLPILEAAGWDVNDCAPSPRGNEGREAYQKAKALRCFFMSITKPKADQTRIYTRNAPQYREPCAEGVAQFIDNDKRNAAFNYEAFQFKLVGKIGACLTETLEGNHVWGHSVLTVTKEGGVVEKWKTQQIMNRSVYGKYFNQYPSRKVK